MSIMQDYVKPEERNFFSIKQMNLNSIQRSFLIDELDDVNLKIRELNARKRNIERLVDTGDRYGR